LKLNEKNELLDENSNEILTEFEIMRKIDRDWNNREIYIEEKFEKLKNI
jgi:hypothetical protein